MSIISFKFEKKKINSIKKRKNFILKILTYIEENIRIIINDFIHENTKKRI